MIIGQFLIVLAEAMQGMPGMDNMPGMDHGADATLAAIFDVLVISRWLHFASIFTLFGSSFFWLTVGRPACSLPWARRATVRLLAFAAPLAALSGLAWLIATIANMTSGFDNATNPENIRLFFFETAFGPVWCFRLILLFAAAATAFLPLRSNVRFALLGVAGAALLIDQAWLGHAAEGGGGFYGMLMIATYCVHTISAGAWVGGLPPLALALFELKRAGPTVAGPKTYEVLARYSVMASVAVSLILLSGIATTWFRTGESLHVLVRSSYGAVLLVKIILVTIMLALAAFNRFGAMPDLRRGASPRLLRASVLAELGLGILVLAAAAVLGITPPPQ